MRVTNELQARYCVRGNWGYRVTLFREFVTEHNEFWEDFKTYDAGNGKYDSQAYGAYDGLDRNTLMRYARQTAREMLIEEGCSKGKILYDGGLLPSTRLLIGW